jgi:RimJ/RimL family protein N-acetyltransferase
MLQPVDEPDLPFLQHLYDSETGPFVELAPISSTQLLERWQRDHFVGDEDRRLLVTTAGHRGGLVSWTARHYGPNPQSRCWNIGIILASDHRGRGLGAAAQSALTDYLFANTDAYRVEAGTDIDHAAERRALTTAAFTLDGILQGAQYRAGTWHDMALYSRTRNTWTGFASREVPSRR